MHWVVRGPHEIELVRRSDDTMSPGPRDVLVKMIYSVVSSGTERAIFTAVDPDVWMSGGWCEYPWESGYAGVGRIVAIGRDVNEFTVGQRVLGTLRHASHHRVCVDDPRWPIMAVPVGVTDLDAAFVRVLGIAFTVLEVVPSQPLRRTALVAGLGLIGNLAAQFLVHNGYHVVGIEPSADRRDIALRAGCSSTVEPDDAASKIGALGDGRGVDIAVDTVGVPAVTLGLPALVAPAGHVVLLTHWRSQPPADATPFVNEVFRKGIHVHGALEYAPSGDPWTDYPRLQLAKWAYLCRLLVAGRLRLADLGRYKVPGTDPVAAYELAFSSPPPDLLTVVADWQST